MLGKLFGGEKKKRGPAAERLSPAITEAIVGIVGSRGLPSMPGNAQKAFQLATDPNADARDFVSVIQSDEALSARIIRIANSVYFDRGKASKTIEESVTVIGINELRCLLNATALTDIFPSTHPLRAVLWGNDIATAIIAKSLAQRLLPSSAEQAFLAGLMHDVGKLMLLQRATDSYVKAMKIVEERGCAFTEAEEEVFVFDHTQAGQFIGEKWRFTPDLIAAIRMHHEPWTEGAPTLARVVGAADTIAHALGIGHAKGMHRLRTAAEERLANLWPKLGIDGGQRAGALQDFARLYEGEAELYQQRGKG